MTHVSLFTGIGHGSFMRYNNCMKTVKECEICSREFVSYNPNPRFCSSRCKAAAQSAGVDLVEAIKLYESGMTQDEIGKRFGTTQKAIHGLFKRHGYVCRRAAKRDQYGERNHAWKGDEAGYQAMHLRVESRRGKASTHVCSRCAIVIADDWANLSGRYSDVNDYAPMCRSCHRKYDKKRRSKCQSAGT